MSKYNKWNNIKKDISNKENNLIFKNREIFWLQLGCNIGFETNGKGDEFLRPILVLRKFSKDSFLGKCLHKINVIHYFRVIKAYS